MKNDCIAFGCAILLTLVAMVSMAETGETKFMGNGSWHDSNLLEQRRAERFDEGHCVWNGHRR